VSGRRSRFQARCGIRRFGSRWTPRLRRSRCSPGMQARRGSPTRFAYNECLRFVTDALAAKRNDPSVKVPWSGYDLINAFNAWKRSEEAGRVFVVDTNGLISRQVTGLAWRQKVSAQGSASRGASAKVAAATVSACGTSASRVAACSVWGTGPSGR